MRVARPTGNLAGIADMYAKGLGFSVLARFAEHEGFDGVILGAPEQPYHLEFTAHRGHVAGRAPTKDHLLVFYIPDREAWEDRCARMIAAGFRGVASYNPFWDIQGRTFEDLDGYRVVLENAVWNGS
jgi:hypothetical protein